MDNFTYLLVIFIFSFIFFYVILKPIFKRKKIAVPLSAALAIILLSVYLQIVGLPLEYGVKYSGFLRIIPLVPSVSYNGGTGTFTASFSNALGTSMKIKKMYLENERDPSVSCGKVFLKKHLNKTYTLIDVEEQIIKAGDTFIISANCAGRGPIKKTDEPFDFKVHMDYTYLSDGESRNGTEEGKILGKSEE